MRSGGPHWSSVDHRERDAVLSALAHPCRRHVVDYLEGIAEARTVTELAAVVAATTIRTDGVEPVRGVDAIETSLYHVHLPKLAEAELVEFSHADGTVAPTARTEAVVPILSALGEI